MTSGVQENAAETGDVSRGRFGDILRLRPDSERMELSVGIVHDVLDPLFFGDLSKFVLTGGIRVLFSGDGEK